MNEYRVRRGRPIAGEITVPGDHGITPVAIAVAALANGPSVLNGFLPSAQCRALLEGIVGYGVKVEYLAGEDADILWQPDPEHPDALPTRVRIQGISMSKGARGIIELLPAGADRDILSALLKLGKTAVALPAHHPDHAARILRHFQVKTALRDRILTVYGGQMPESRDIRIPGDTSVAAQWITAAAMQPGSDLTVRGMGLNTTRTAFLRVLVGMGAQITEDFWPSHTGEPIGSVIVRGAPLRGVKLDAAQTTACPNELPALAVAAAFAGGPTVIRIPPELSALAARITHHLRLTGVTVNDLRDGFEITGSNLAPLQSGCLPSYGEPFLAMAFAVAGLFGEGETIIEDIACVEKTWAGFGHELRRFQSRAISDGIATPVINTWMTKAAPQTGNPKPQPTHPK